MGVWRMDGETCGGVYRVECKWVISRQLRVRKIEDRIVSIRMGAVKESAHECRSSILNSRFHLPNAFKHGRSPWH